MQFEQAYQADVEITLKVWDDEIDRLVEKREKAEARIGYSCLIAVLHSKRDEIRTDLGRLYKAQVSAVEPARE